MDDTARLTSSGGSGLNGFAQLVCDSIKRRASEVEQSDASNHCRIVCNLGTDWHGAFRGLIEDNPLPPTFCAKSDNLDQCCRFMLAVWAQLVAESHGKKVIFHLLVPT